MDEEVSTGNHLQGSHNQGVTVVIGDRLGKFILASLVVGIILLFAVGAAAYRAELKADNAIKTADYSSNEFRMTQYWMQRTSLACQNNDRIPPIPASLLLK